MGCLMFFFGIPFVPIFLLDWLSLHFLNSDDNRCL